MRGVHPGFGSLGHKEPVKPEGFCSGHALSRRLCDSSLANSFADAVRIVGDVLQVLLIKIHLHSPRSTQEIGAESFVFLTMQWLINERCPLSGPHVTWLQ